MLSGGGGSLNNMPRLTDKQYLEYRKFLRRLWLHRQEAYSYLTPTQQWQIHDYFRPSEELTTEQLLQHRKDIAAKRPSLPHQVGRTIKEFGQVMRGKAKPRGVTELKVPASGRGRARTIRVRGIVRPQIDYDKLALACIMSARQKLGLDTPQDDKTRENVEDYKRWLADTTYAKVLSEFQKQHNEGSTKG